MMRWALAAVFVSAFVSPGIAAAQQPTSAPSGAPPSQATLFTPPPGWIASPQRMQLPTTWRPDAPAALGETISIMPFPVSVVMSSIADTMTQPFRNMGASVSTSQVTRCGAPATLLVAKFPNSSKIIETTFESSNGTMYAVSYAHAAVVDAAAEAFVRAACPASPDRIAALSPPAGWSVAAGMHALGSWQNANAGDSLTEMIGPATPALDAARSAQALSSMPSTPNMPHMVITQKPGFLLCGHAAIESTGTLSASALRVQMDIVTTSTRDRSYMLTYTTLQTAFDPTVVAAMHAFCPT
jgi:hypothetical protein